MSKTMKKKAKQFIRKHKLKTVSFETLKTSAEQCGYTVIEFNSLYNSKNLQIIIKNLQIENAIRSSRGFTYADKNYRLIFINEDLNYDEKILVISHELGHVVCEHFKTIPIIGKDVKEEYEANEFSHYLLKESFPRKIQYLVNKSKTITIIILMIIVSLITVFVGIAIHREKVYYGDYYSTSTGNKYHKKECIFTKDKKTVERLNKKEFEEGNYEACDICLPDK